jgi:Cu+-exporting ATPase
MKKLIIKINGMSCASCSATIERALKKVEGLIDVNVNYPAGKAFVTYEPERIDVSYIEELITKVGYDVVESYDPEANQTSVNTIKLNVTGMSCASCSSAVERALKKTSGVKRVNVNLASEVATIEIDSNLTNEKALKEAVINAGYGIQTEKALDNEAENLQVAKKRMIIIWAVTLPIMVWMIPMMLFGIMWPDHITHNIGVLLLASIGLFTVGMKTFKSAFKSLIHASANMDVLITLGTGAAYITGFLHFFMDIASFAGISAMIMAFHLTGRYIEVKAKGRASQAIKKLLELGAKTALIEEDGQEKEVPVESLELGQIMLVKPGSKIPTDGQIVEGATSIDESMATGESFPVKKVIGDNVLGATINQNGFIKVRVEKVGKETFLSQIIKMVEEAQGSKVPIQEFADKVTAFFVPIVILLALIAFASWLIFPDTLQAISLWASQYLAWVNPQANSLTQAIFATVAVLVIACPCALGLATPTALMVGSGMGAENGILIRNGAAIQTMKDVAVIVFDKTGTITKGKPEVTDIYSNSLSETQVMQLAASLESRSEHPLARAMINYCKTKNISFEQAKAFASLSGLGLSGQVEDKKIFLGNRKLLEEHAIDYQNYADRIDKLEKEAKTVILLADEKEMLALIAVADALKEDSGMAIARLHKLGFKTAMISGDNDKTAQAIAKKVGIDFVASQVLPDQKVEEIKKFQEKYGLVAMVGDGINDAPALKQANVGIAIGTGTDIAIESSDITLVKGSLMSVVQAIKLSQETFKKIKQNLFWAFAYNLIAIPLAFTGMLHPVIAEIAMATSSITVVTNSNRLRKRNLNPK